MPSSRIDYAQIRLSPLIMTVNGGDVVNREDRFGVDPFRGQILEIWQGTILGTPDGELKPKLVISADCDLLGDKGLGQFFCLDLWKPDAFLRFVVPQVLEEFVEILTECARETAATRNSVFSAVSISVLSDWIAYGDRSRWAVDLPNHHVNDLDLLAAISECVKRFRFEHENFAAVEEQPSIFLSSENLQLKAKIDQLNKKLRRVLEGRLDYQRADMYVFPPIPGRNGSGYFVPFTSLGLLSRKYVSTCRADLPGMADAYYPIAICRPILLQSLLQKLVLYFTRIGLTDGFKNEQKAVVKAVMEKIV